MPFLELDEPTGEFALISDLIVVERFRGRGYGRLLLEGAERFAREHGATDLRIGVLAANERARRLYRRAGFATHMEVLAKRVDRDH